MAKKDKKAEQAETENVMVVNIKFSPKWVFQRKPNETQYDESELPDALELTIPAKVCEQRNHPDYFEIVESFIYNLISAQYGRAVTYCQIYFP